MIGVLFVCLGNICRSPMAEAVFRHLVNEAGLADQITIDSAGLGGWHEGEPPHKGTQQILRDRQIKFDTIRARQIKPADFADYSYIICMDEENLSGLRRLAPKEVEISRLLDFAYDYQERNIEDPYYTGRFEHVYDLVDAGCRGLLKHICQENGLK